MGQISHSGNDKRLFISILLRFFLYCRNKFSIMKIRRLGRKTYQHVVSFKKDNISCEAVFFQACPEKM